MRPHRQRPHVLASLLLVLVVLTVITTTVVVTAECPATGCGPFGNCILETRACKPNCVESCKCDTDFTGDDCSFQAVTCEGDVGPDNIRTCFNGGVCKRVTDSNELKDNGLEWKCDCVAAAVASRTTPAVVAGHQCEFASQTSCESGNPSSIYAFCVNDGTCLDPLIPSGKPHVGCLCGPEHEGRHCQYAAGTAPEAELAYLREQQKAASGDGSNGMTGVGIFFVVFAATMVLAAVGYFLYTKRARASTKDDHDGIEESSSPVAAAAIESNDLQLEEGTDTTVSKDADEGSSGDGNGDVVSEATNEAGVMAEQAEII